MRHGDDHRAVLGDVLVPSPLRGHQGQELRSADGHSELILENRLEHRGIVVQVKVDAVDIETRRIRDRDRDAGTASNLSIRRVHGDLTGRLLDIETVSP